MKQPIPRLSCIVLSVMASISCSSCKTSPEPQTEIREAVTPEAAMAPAATSVKTIKTAFTPANGDDLSVCSFNIQFLGHWPRSADANKKLAKLLKNCDIALIQEVVAPPADIVIKLANGQPKTMNEDAESKDFFKQMKNLGFDGTVISPEKTGFNSNHTATSVSEFFVAFYKTTAVDVAPDLPSGYISAPLFKNSSFDRVPYAFAFRRKAAGASDFVLISVHLHANDGNAEEKRRDQGQRIAEFHRIVSWINTQRQSSAERDFLVVGDMNVEDEDELNAFLGEVNDDIAPYLEVFQSQGEPGAPVSELKKFKSLNDKAVGTNLKLDKPYDHVIFDPADTKELHLAWELIDLGAVYDLAEAESSKWFMMTYSDHVPLRFMLKAVPDDD